MRRYQILTEENGIISEEDTIDKAKKSILEILPDYKDGTKFYIAEVISTATLALKLTTFAWSQDD